MQRSGEDLKDIGECGGAVILAGGDSKRMGQPKALLDFFGMTLIERIVGILSPLFPSLTLVTDRPDLYSGLPAKITPDLISGGQKSPLRGIHAGLTVSTLPCQFVVACDMPLLNRDLIAFMVEEAEGYDAVVPRLGPHYQPLHAVYSRSSIAVIEKLLEEQRYKVTDFYEHLNIRYITEAEIERFDPGQVSFTNINTWGDYENALRLIRSG